MASDLPYSLFADNVSENISVSTTASEEDNEGSPKIWRSDKGHDVFSIKKEHAYMTGDRITNGEYDSWSNKYVEVLEGDWLNDRRFTSHVSTEKLKSEENLKGDTDHPNIEDSRQREVFMESRVREIELKTFAAVTEWFEDLQVKSRELEGATMIETEITELDPKDWLAGLWRMAHTNSGIMCPPGEKPGNTMREDNWLLAEWGACIAENQSILECDNHNPNANRSVPKNKANWEYQETISSKWNGLDIMLGFHIPDNQGWLPGEQGEGLETQRGNNLNKMLGRFNDLAYEVVAMDKQMLLPREEETGAAPKPVGDRHLHESTADMAKLFGATSRFPRFINSDTSVVHLVKENNFTHDRPMCMQVDFAEPSQRGTDTGFIGCSGSGQVENDMQFGVLKECNEQVDPRGSPHEAIFFTLSYLSLQDLFSVERVCKSLRAAVKNDVLLWRHLHVEHPLSKKLTNDTLLQLSARAQGHLQCLSLVDCFKITDDGLKRVLDSNPKLTKLCLPGCTRITAEGIVTMVKGHTEQNGDRMPGLKHLRIRGLYGLTKDHLDNLKASLDGGLQQQSELVKPQFYHNGHYMFSYHDDRSIDVEVCPKCENARLVYDCPRERCQKKKGHKLQQCRGCIFCIARCEECGRCIDDNEFEETFCLDLLCSACWLQLPKCLECNRPGCGRHADHFIRRPDTSFVCGDCMGVSAGCLGPDFDDFA